MNMTQKTEGEIETEEASPEEEQQYQQAYDMAMRSLHSGKVAKSTIARVLNAESPAKGIAAAAFVLIRRTEEQMKGIEDSVKIQLAEDLVMEVLSMMVESGRMQESEATDELIEEVVKELYQKYAADAADRGEMDPETIQQDVAAGEAIMNRGEKPQGQNAMSNNEAETRGLMNV
jgi:SOS response regulatory protein OraA/RecX